MTKSVLLLPLMVCLSGCAAAQPTKLIVVTDGFQAVKPTPGTRAVFLDFWERPPRAGRHPLGEMHGTFREAEAAWRREHGGRGEPDLSAERRRALQQAAAAWLREHGGIEMLVPRDSRDELLEEQRFRLRQDDADDLKVGRLRGASLVINVEGTERWGQEPEVRIQAASVETGEIVWWGSARFPGPGGRRDPGTAFFCVWADRISLPFLGWMMTGALETAFGLLPPSRHAVDERVRRVDARGCAETPGYTGYTRP
ncbi:MAG: hypothetical protein ACRDGM_02280 [bacterium]